MKSKIVKRSLLSILAVALVSIVLWGLAEGKPDTTIVIFAVINIIITTCIWFSFAWKALDANLRDALPAFAICLVPYVLTAGLDIYMVPYNYSGGENMWAWILDSYGNIFFNSSYHLLASVAGDSIVTSSLVILLLQILLPLALTFIIRFGGRFVLTKTSGSVANKS
jgi:hypothetical protein